MLCKFADAAAGGINCRRTGGTITHIGADSRTLELQETLTQTQDATAQMAYRSKILAALKAGGS